MWRAQSLRLDDSCILIYDTTTKFLGHWRVYSCICAKEGLYLCESGASVLVFVRKTEKSWRTWRVSSGLRVDVLRGGADACTPPLLKMMNIWGVQLSTNYVSPSFFKFLLLIFHICTFQWLNRTNMKDELNRSYNGGGVEYQLQSELSYSTL